MTTARCRACGHSAEGDARFCTHCGARMPSAAPSIPGHELLEQLDAGPGQIEWLGRSTEDDEKRVVMVGEAVNQGGWKRLSDAWGRVSHPRIERFSATGRLSTGEPWRARAVIGGERISERLAERGRLDAAEALSILERVAELADELAYAKCPAARIHASDLIESPEGLVLVSAEAESDGSFKAERVVARLAAELVLSPREREKALAAGDEQAAVRILSDALASSAGLPPSWRNVLGDSLRSGSAGSAQAFVQRLSEASSSAFAPDATMLAKAPTRARGKAWMPVALVGVSVLALCVAVWGFRAQRQLRERKAQQASTPEQDSMPINEARPVSAPAETLDDVLARARNGEASALVEAETRAGAALAAESSDARALRAFGQIHALRGDMNAAAAWLDAAVAAAAARPTSLGPDEAVDLLLDAAVAHAAAGDSDRAELLLSRLLTQAPSHARALANLGILRLAAGDLDSGETHLKSALAAEPGLLVARCALAASLRSRGLATEAKEQIDLALASDPACSCALSLR